MLKIQKYAAIDIGSNAVRLLISNIIKLDNEPVVFKKNSLVRVPISLGADVFMNGEISEYNQERMIDTMKAFSLIMKSHGVVRYKACATSAMREANNSQPLSDKILNTIYKTYEPVLSWAEQRQLSRHPLAIVSH